MTLKDWKLGSIGGPGSVATPLRRFVYTDRGRRRWALCEVENGWRPLLCNEDDFERIVVTSLEDVRAYAAKRGDALGRLLVEALVAWRELAGSDRRSAATAAEAVSA